MQNQEEGYENYLRQDHLRQNSVIFCHILSPNSLIKCMGISLENFKLNIGA